MKSINNRRAWSQRLETNKLAKSFKTNCGNLWSRHYSWVKSLPRSMYRELNQDKKPTIKRNQKTSSLRCRGSLLAIVSFILNGVQGWKVSALINSLSPSMPPIYCQKYSTKINIYKHMYNYVNSYTIIHCWSKRCNISLSKPFTVIDEVSTETTFTQCVFFLNFCVKNILVLRPWFAVLMNSSSGRIYD